MMHVDDVMSGDPLTLELDDHLDMAGALMRSCRIRHLPVTRRGLLMGMVSLRDLAKITAPAEVAACEVMHAPVETVAPGDSLAVAAACLLAHGFSSLPVVEHGHLIGIVTTTDLVRAACDLLGDAHVCDLMTAAPAESAVTVEADASAVAVGHLLVRDRLDSVGVVREGRAVGVLGVFDYLRFLAA